MADITVHVDGVASQGGQPNPQPQQQPQPTIPPQPTPQPQPSATGTTGNASVGTSQAAPPSAPLPPSNSLVEDIRREITLRGAMLVPGTQNFQTLMNTIRQQKSTQLGDSVSNFWNGQRADIDQERDKEIKAKTDEINKQRQAQLLAAPDSLHNQINANFDRQVRNARNAIEQKFAPAYQAVDQREKADKQHAEERLTQALEELNNQLRDKSENSFVGQMRARYARAVYDRDTAASPEEARRYAAQANQIQRELGEALNPQQQQINPFTLIQRSAPFLIAGQAIDLGHQWYQNRMMNQRTDVSVLSSAAQGNPYTALQEDANRRIQNRSWAARAIGTTVGGIAGGILAATGTIGVGTGVGIAGGAALGGAFGNWVGNILNDASGDQVLINRAQLAQMMQSQAQREMGYNDLAILTSGGTNIAQRRENMIINPMDIMNPDNTSGTTIYDLGLSAPQFAQMAAQRIRARGFGGTEGDAAIRRAFQSEILERIYSTGSGALNSMAQWDRFGDNPGNYNQTFANLIATMNALRTRGLSNGDWGRSNEFIGYYNQMMQMQQSQGVLAPNSDVALSDVATLQSLFGNNLTSRQFSEYGQLMGTLQHPQAGMGQTILYDVIQKLHPETVGNLAAIRRYQYTQNPTERLRIRNALMQRVRRMYGGVNTTSGMLAFQQLFGIENPWEQIEFQKLPYRQQNVRTGSISAAEQQIQGLTPQAAQVPNRVADKTAQDLHNEQYQQIMQGMMQTLLDDFSTKLQEIVENTGAMAQ